MKRILVCGGRDFKDAAMVEWALNRILWRVQAIDDGMVVVHGDCRGADRLGQDWAEINGIQTEKHPANWRAHGRSAGPLRNRQMLETGIDLVVAFPGGDGTADMCTAADEKKVPTWVPDTSWSEHATSEDTSGNPGVTQA
jgi:predicted polyphosphate/ATP-dependent NAD kinase